MLVIALVGLYCTLLCWTWGHLSLRLLSLVTRTEQPMLPAFSIVCLSGLSLLMVVAAALSIWMPVGGAGLQLALLLVAVLYAGFNRTVQRDMLGLWRKGARLHPLSIGLLLSTGLLLLMLGAWQVVHPDTLAYHAQLIQWIAAYKAIPGLAHLHIRYGLQNNWFVAGALFSFPFLHTAALTFVNTCVAGWFILFMVGRLEENKPGREAEAWSKEKIIRFILWGLLLAYTWWDVGMLRLTAASASPDFVAGVYGWLVFYLLITSRTEANWVLIFFFSILAVLVKLSSAPLLLLAGYALYHLFSNGQRRAVWVLIVFSLLAGGTYLARNVITTGNPLFPSPLFEVLQVDWKIDQERTRSVQKYIGDYARMGEKAQLGVPLKVIGKEWISLWWKNRSGAEKTALLGLLGSIILGSIFYKKAGLGSSLRTRLFLLVSAAGLLFWFIQAPDPRFGYAFIFPVLGQLLYRLAMAHWLPIAWPKQAGSIILAVFITGIAGFTVYRFTHFFYSRDLLFPEGIPPVATKEFRQRGIVFRMPCHVCGCGSTPLPCAYDDEPFELRGKTLTEGFRNARPLRSDR